jgi:hypothetical protein
MRTKLFTSLVLGLGLLGACAGQTGSTSLDQGELALVSVSADDLEALDDSETLTIDLTKKNVVYEIDGDSAPLDLERLTVMTSSAESMPMRDFLDTTALAIDENDFFLRLSNDPKLLLETTPLGSQSQALKGRIGGGGGGLGVVACVPGFCVCDTYDDCIDMFDGDLCGPLGGCDDTNGTNCWCIPSRGKTVTKPKVDTVLTTPTVEKVELAP